MHQDRWSRAGAPRTDGVPADRRRETDRLELGTRAALGLCNEAGDPAATIHGRRLSARIRAEAKSTAADGEGATGA